MTPMRTGSRPWRMVAIFALPIALWAALPALQFCRLGVSQVRPECVFGTYVAQAALSHESALPAADVATPCSGASAPTSCSAASETSCPFAARCAPSSQAAGRDHPCTADCERVDARTHSSNHHAHHARAFCLGGPNGGTGVRPHSPQLRTHAPPPAIVTATLALASLPHQTRRVAPQLAVRPPPRLWITRAPIRGPPVA